MNASATGILFRCQKREDVSQHVEVELALPDGLAGVKARLVVTRAEAAADGSSDWMIASKIVGYTLSRTS